MKKLLLGLALAGITSAFGQSYYITNNLAGSTNHVTVNSAHYLNEITFFTTNQNATIVRLFDGSVESVLPARTNYVVYTTNLVTSYVTTLGTTNTYTNKYVYVQANPSAASTNVATPVATIVVPGSPIADTQGSPYVFKPVLPILFVSSLNISNTQTGLSAVINYRRP